MSKRLQLKANMYIVYSRLIPARVWLRVAGIRERAQSGLQSLFSGFLDIFRLPERIATVIFLRNLRNEDGVLVYRIS